MTAIFTPTGGDGRTNFAAVKIVMQPAQIVAIDDIVHTLLQSAGTGQLQIVGANDQILINSRTYTPSSSGTYGQFVPSAVASESVGAGDLPLSIPGLENTSGFRSNIGFAEVAGAAGEIRVRFYDAAGNAVADEVYGIAPFGHVQTRVNPFGEALRAEVTVAGGARVLAYGSMVDNSSGDAVFIPAARTRSGIFPAIHAPGANGTLWRTDVWLSNPGATAEDVVMNQRSFTVPAHGSVVVRDVLGVDGRAALQVDTAAVLVTSRTYTIGAQGSFGQFVPPGVASSELATLIGVENSSAFRTNVGLLSQGTAFVRVLFFDAASRQIWREHVAVDHFAQFQLMPALTLLGGWCQVRVLSGMPVIPYASVVDNVSGDPIFITAQY